MTESVRTLPGDWYPGTIPSNAQLAETAYIETTLSFSRWHSQVPVALRMGYGASAYRGTMFDIGPMGRLSIGEYALLNGVWIICDTEVTIGDYTLCSWNVVIMDTYRAHESSVKRRAMLEQISQQTPRHLHADRPGQPVHIGKNVWLGFDVCILPGVCIGEGAIVGARSVVIDDVEPYAIVGGNPARIIKTLKPPRSSG